MKKYKQKPVHVEAVQFNCNTIREAVKFIIDNKLEGFTAKYKKLPKQLRTALVLRIPPKVKGGAEKFVSVGDWVLKSESGLYSISSKNIFPEVFEEVEE